MHMQIEQQFTINQLSGSHHIRILISPHANWAIHHNQIIFTHTQIEQCITNNFYPHVNWAIHHKQLLPILKLSYTLQSNNCYPHANWAIHHNHWVNHISIFCHAQTEQYITINHDIPADVPQNCNDSDGNWTFPHHQSHEHMQQRIRHSFLLVWLADSSGLLPLKVSTA